MAAVVYWAKWNSKHDLSAPSIPLRVRLVEVTSTSTQIAGYTGQMGGSAKCLLNEIMLLQVQYNKVTSQ